MRIGILRQTRATTIRPLIKHRVFAPYDHAHNARIDDERYHQRSMTETANSALKRSHGLSQRVSYCFVPDPRVSIMVA
jgi:hypothetical protein